MEDTTHLTPRAQRLRDGLVTSMRRHVGKQLRDATRMDEFMAGATALRDELAERMLETEDRFRRADAKRVYYLSMEFLIGRSLGNNLYNLEIFDDAAAAFEAIGADIEEIRSVEPDAALGNGGLGRLAACFLDSMATLGIPGYGYGINYEYGLFRQVIEDGYQVEVPDDWRSRGSAWLIHRPDDAIRIPIYGRLGPGDPAERREWLDTDSILGVPSDMPIAGYGGHTVNYLRLYQAKAPEGFDVALFNEGRFMDAVARQARVERISKVLYPSDESDAGRELRLTQEYFFVACALRDIVRRYLRDHIGFTAFPDKVAIQLNDTHPAIAIAEMMRLLVDEHEMKWDQAWLITQATFGYTNHTLLPEALEKWSLPLLERLLPRHMDIIRLINLRFLETVNAIYPGDMDRIRAMSIIEEGPVQNVRMANLAIIGSHAVNGVAALHTRLLQERVIPEFAQLWPEKFTNKTNGVTQRRWLLNANRRLASIITSRIGADWITDLDALQALEPWADDPEFQQAFRDVKRNRKERVARDALVQTNTVLDPDSLFDVQAKRIHEYKRQLLLAMYMIHQYLVTADDGILPAVPRTFLVAGKAAPSYAMAKLIIKLINAVSRTMNNDSRTRDVMRGAFMPDYRVSAARQLIPCADLSEQISTAGKEASGTGNMKFALNGALTIGTLDGANIEIAEQVGPDNIFIFGLTAEQVQAMRERGYHPREWYERTPAIRRVLDAIAENRFCPEAPGLFQPILDSLLGSDPYFHLADFESYLAAQAAAETLYQDQAAWTRKAILNVARIGFFSSDRTIREYARDIWNVPVPGPRPVTIGDQV